MAADLLLVLLRFPRDKRMSAAVLKCVCVCVWVGVCVWGGGGGGGGGYKALLPLSSFTQQETAIYS